MWHPWDSCRGASQQHNNNGKLAGWLMQIHKKNREQALLASSLMKMMRGEQAWNMDMSQRLKDEHFANQPPASADSEKNHCVGVWLWAHTVLWSTAPKWWIFLVANPPLYGFSFCVCYEWVSEWVSEKWGETWRKEEKEREKNRIGWGNTGPLDWGRVSKDRNNTVALLRTTPQQAHNTPKRNKKVESSTNGPIPLGPNARPEGLTPRTASTIVLGETLQKILTLCVRISFSPQKRKDGLKQGAARCSQLNKKNMTSPVYRCKTWELHGKTKTKKKQSSTIWHQTPAGILA